MSAPNTKTFEIGLAMAGAISAGAYSGGVLDFLLQALDEWQKAKDAGTAGIPNHQVIIKVMSGASAGAITGAIGAIALAGGLKPTPFAQPAPARQKFQYMLPHLYNAWVVQPRFVAPAGGGTDFLTLQDLQQQSGEPIVKSVLNCTLLDQISADAVKVAPSGSPLPYVAKDLHVYLTLSNLRGVPYAIEFQGGGYGMQSHGDRAHYVVKDLGSWDTVSPWASKDDSQSLDVSTLSEGGGSADWQKYALSAVASGAFPVGLAPREIETMTSWYDKRYLPIDVPKLDYMPPAWPWPWFQKEPRDFTFLSVDGGVINNEPFEYAHYALMTHPPKPNDRTGAADRAVIMIDPFPEPPTFAGDGKPDPDLASVVAALLPALIQQARFKPSELADAAAADVYSRFLIAPHRQLPNKMKEELYAIACGVLSGFGGFLDEQFRAHDYQLGRRNCQRFLRDVFALPAENSIIEAWPAPAKDNPAFQTIKLKDGKPQYCIIPLLGTASDTGGEVPLQPWPRMSQADLDILQSRIKTRLRALVPVLVERQTASKALRLALKVAARVSEPRVLEYVKYFILSDLVRRDQAAGWELPDELPSDRGQDALNELRRRDQSSARDLPDGATPPDTANNVRAVVAELAHPAYDFRTIAGISAATGLKNDYVALVLVFLERQTGKPYLAWQTAMPDQTPIYTLDSRKPSPAWQLPIIRSIGDWVAAPVIN
jgi:hypothetical protein